MAHAPSPQQQRVLDWVSVGRGSARVEAVAGAGKTTTLVQAVARTTGSVAVCAYNKKIAKEIEGKIAEAVPGAGNRVRVGTFHSHGFNAWRRHAPTVRLDDKKLAGCWATVAAAWDGMGDGPEIYKTFAMDAAAMARQVGIGALVPFADRRAWLDMIDRHDLRQSLPEETDGHEDAVTTGLRWACLLLRESNRIARDVIDFDDMIYQPLLCNVRMWQNDWVLVDEAQDLNPVRRALAKKMLRPGGRAVFVGDPRQAIYGFTGADADSFERIAAEFATTDLPLTVTFRCPRTVAALANTYVGAIEAAPTAPEGVVRHMSGEEWQTDVVPTLTAGEDAILCRNTKPLVSMCYALIKAGVPARIEGRAIGEGLIKLAGRWKARTVRTLDGRLADYREREIAKHMARGNEAAADAVADKVDALRAMIEGMEPTATVDALRARIREMFEDSDGARRPAVVLSTIHRSKGLEWHRVHWYGSDRFQPSPYARQAWQLDQENNLMYVAATRAQRELYVVNIGAAAPREGGA